MVELKNIAIDFELMHDSFLEDWNMAMATGETSDLDRMTEDYYVTFFRSANDRPAFFNKQEAIDGLNQSVMHFRGCQKRFENRVIRLRNKENAVVFYEQLIVKNEEVLARLFTIENWQLIQQKWMIVRETEEAIN
ncbi:hypothetical protein [Mesobacillus jeotgali]|uniref:hypothetical protein n=1 Tax=Mesobacillus jeotgali TaxID=129985 RepID=UPI0022267363|nr:hypothetical protein [Mesobacillus jeotgali]UYZ22487.1 hypothetical protein FOF60_02540 [Mesobacillus jeotgali]